MKRSRVASVIEVWRLAVSSGKMGFLEIVAVVAGQIALGSGRFRHHVERRGKRKIRVHVITKLTLRAVLCKSLEING